MENLDKKISVALIGSGPIAREHLLAFRATLRAEVIAVYSRKLKNAKNLAQREGIPLATNKLSDLFTGALPDLIIVAVAVEATAEIVVSLLKFGVPMLVEKPLGINFDENEKIMAVIKNKNASVFVAMNRRCYGSTRLALEKIESEVHPRFIEINDQQAPNELDVSSYSPEVIRYWMFANAIHLIDYAFIFGRGNVKNSKVLTPWKGQTQSSVLSAMISFDTGDYAIYTCRWNMPGPWSCAISTPELRLEMKPLEQITVQCRGSRKQVVVPVDEVDQNFKPGFYIQALEMIDFVQYNKMPTFLVDAFANKEVMALTEKLYFT